jgi:endo-1,4-beta-xylanase
VTAAIDAHEHGAYTLDVTLERARQIKSSILIFVGGIGDRRQCLDVAHASIRDHADVQQFTCHAQTNQRWYLRDESPRQPRAGTGAPFPHGGLFRPFSIFADHSGKCLDVAQDAQGTNVQQFTWHGGANQRWYLIPTDPADAVTDPDPALELALGTGREYFIVSDSHTRVTVLEVEGAATFDGANVRVNDFHGGSNQRWLIAPTPLFDSDSVTG